MQPIGWILVLYLAAVNLLGAGAVVLDKWCAQHGRWRIRERTLFLYAWLGGCPLVYLAMKLCRHKTAIAPLCGVFRQSLCCKSPQSPRFYTYCIKKGVGCHDRIFNPARFG